MWNNIITHIDTLGTVALAVLLHIIQIVVIVFVGIQITKLVEKVLHDFFKKVQMDMGLQTFVLASAKAACYAIIVLIVATRIGVNAASIIAVVGSVGVALGLALQGSLSNLAGGILILFIKPFVVGDYIITPLGEGVVVAIGLVYTSLLTPDNKNVTIPNGTLANDVITNVTANDIRRLDMTVGISYQADFAHAKVVLENIFRTEERVLKDKEMQVYISDLASSSVMVGIRCWCKSSDYWQLKCYLLEAIKLHFEKEHIEIPFNQIDVHLVS